MIGQVAFEARDPPPKIGGIRTSFKQEGAIVGFQKKDVGTGGKAHHGGVGLTRVRDQSEPDPAHFEVVARSRRRIVAEFEGEEVDTANLIGFKRFDGEQ